MDFEVEAALPGLVDRGLLAPGAAETIARIARGRRVSVHGDLRALLYVGVVLLTTGAGLRLSTAAGGLVTAVVALLFAAGASGCFAWVTRRARPFSWGPVPSPHLAFDYLLTLGVLLLGALLLWLEARLGMTGGWSGHLVFLALLSLGLAFRHDSRLLFGLALGDLCAWRGIAVNSLGTLERLDADRALRWNACALGAAFVVFGLALLRTGSKAHFEPVASELGALLVFLALALGMLHAEGLVTHAAVLIGAGAGVAFAARGARTRLFALGAVAAYVGLSGLVVKAAGHAGSLIFLWFTASALGLVIAVVRRAVRIKAEPSA